jgi:hypothetical protein
MPINNPHRDRLEEERRGLLRQKTAIRKFLEQAPFRLDSTDLAVARRDAAAQLSFLQREYEEICFQLGRNPDTRAVKL